MSTAIILLIISVLCIPTGIWYERSCHHRPRKVVEFNGKKPAMLGSVNTIGFTMLGNFVYRDGLPVSYWCLSIFGCPLIPLGCYCCYVTDEQWNNTQYAFHGSMPWKAEEVLCLYSRWFWIVGFIAVCQFL